MKHLLFETNKNDLLNASLSIPEESLPKSFYFKNEDFICGGYALIFNQNYKINDLVRFAKEEKWQELSKINADFIILFLSLKKNRIFVLTGQSGAFPCYFSLFENNLALSTGFGFLKNNLKVKNLDLDWALDYISFSTLISERTVLEEIKQVPPGTLLEINSDFSYKLTPLVDLKDALENLPPKYTSKEKYRDDFIKTLSEVLSDNLTAICGATFSCDLSSGLDVNLIAYLLKNNFKQELTCFSRISEASSEETKVSLTTDFANKHNLLLKIFLADDYFPFSQQHELDWIMDHFYPADHGEELGFQLCSKIKSAGFNVEFTGDGGDEVYRFEKFEESERFAIQRAYFILKQTLEGGLEDLVTDLGREKVLSKKRFENKKYYPSVLPKSPVMISNLYFPIYWELGIWTVNPFNDLRMARFGSLIPKGMTKYDLWKDELEIFLPEQFKPKAHFEEHIGLYLDKKKDLVINILQNSVLNKTGLFKIGEIIDNISKRNTAPYKIRPFAGLDNLLRLDYFLQKNGVKIEEQKVDTGGKRWSIRN